MNRFRLASRGRLILPAVVLLGFGGCLGPNPGFFISTGIANATIFGIVQRLLAGILGASS